MGRQGGQGKGKPKLKDRDFGKSLISNLKSSKKEGDKKGEFNPMSVLEQDHLDEVGGFILLLWIAMIYNLSL
jgi:hypothetical protein